jgi:2Fe-2S ferredoxin
MPKVTFCNAQGKVLKEIEVPEGTLLFDAATQAGLPVASSCLKENVCGKCVMRIRSGAENLSPVVAHETRLLLREQRNPDERISCMAQVRAHCTVSTTYW